MALGIIRRMPGSHVNVDIASERSVSFAPPRVSTQARNGDARGPVAVGPGRSATVGSAPHGALGDILNRYPIQLAKVQRPALRDETLVRDRLLDWLHIRIHDRVVLVLDGVSVVAWSKTSLAASISTASL